MDEFKPPSRKSNRRAAAYALAFGIVLTGAVLAVQSFSGRGTGLTHALLECVTLTVVLTTAVLGWLRFRTQRAAWSIFLGFGFLGVALLDGYRCFTTIDGFQQYLAGESQQVIRDEWSWSASRVFLGLLMVFCWIERRGQLASTASAPMAKKWNYTIGAALLVVSVVSVFSAFVLVPLPDVYQANGFLGRPSELVPGILFLLALVGILTMDGWAHRNLDRFLIYSLIWNAVAQFFAMPRSFQAYDTMFMMAHAMRLIAYLLVMAAFLIDIYDKLRFSAIANRNLAHSQAHLVAAQEKVVTTNRQLEQSNQELEQFAYVASHDLQEPLRAVSGYVKLIQMKLKDDLDEQTISHMSNAVEATERMKSLIEGLLELARVQSTADAFAPQDLNQVVDFAMKNLSLAISDARAEIDVETLPNLAVDAKQITQLFQNLIGNALKFRGELPPRIEIRARELDDSWELSVQDNGIGFDPQKANHMFLVFRRLHQNQNYAGTGIGLSLCKKIVNRHGGSIAASSPGPGHGSKFTFTLLKSLSDSDDPLA